MRSVAAKVFYMSEARLDILDAGSWYRARGTEIAQQFRQQLRRTIGLIRSNPQAYQEVAPGVRRAVVQFFPYEVYYLTDSTSVTIVACLHASRDQDMWRNRVW